MRIGIDAHHLDGKPQGSRTYLLHLIRALQELTPNEDELHVFSFHPEKARKLLDDGGRARHHRVFPESAKIRLPLVVPALELAHHLDVFHSQYIAPPVSFVPEVITIHDVLFETHPELFEGAFSERSVRLIRRSARRARIVLTVSEFSRQAILEAYGLPEDRVVVTPNAVDPERFRPLEEMPRTLRKRYRLDGPFLLSVGRLEPRKNLTRLLRAFAQRDHDASLVLAGAADFRSESILDRVRELGANRVRWLGPVPDEDLPRLYNLAEALVYPSLVEGFGMPVLEAMACGTPVLTTRRGALEELAGDAALFVEPEDEASIARGIDRILTDTALRNRLRAAGLARARTFRWEETARRTLDAYHRAAL